MVTSTHPLPPSPEHRTSDSMKHLSTQNFDQQSSFHQTESPKQYINLFSTGHRHQRPTLLMNNGRTRSRSFGHRTSNGLCQTRKHLITEFTASSLLRQQKPSLSQGKNITSALVPTYPRQTEKLSHYINTPSMVHQNLKFDSYCKPIGLLTTNNGSLPQHENVSVNILNSFARGLHVLPVQELVYQPAHIFTPSNIIFSGGNSQKLSVKKASLCVKDNSLLGNKTPTTDQSVENANSRVLESFNSIDPELRLTYRTDANILPPYSLHTLLVMCLRSMKRQRVTFYDMCQWMEENFAAYRETRKNWQVNLMANMYLNSWCLCFYG